jgi:hypothetical protein
MNNEITVRKQYNRKTYNTYIDIALMDLVDEWAQRDGSSRSAIIEMALEECFLHNNMNSIRGKLRCLHPDLNKAFFESRGMTDFKLDLGGHPIVDTGKIDG